jgi:cytidine deaminase
LAVNVLSTDAEAQKLIRESARARGFSYSPYSKFKVGSALLCEDGSVRTGCNVENASFSVTICAERCALIKAISEGRQSFRSIGVVADRIDGRLTTPCGVCRQMLSEFGDFDVYVASPDMRQVLVTTTHELLPHVFRKGSKDNFISADGSV